MAYYTEFELRNRSGISASAAGESLRRSASETTGAFDAFLGHSMPDAAVILGRKSLLEAQGLRVYVDWIVDSGLGRASVSAATANRLRERMSSSRSLVYATSRAASRSRWMPWELGYFDGAKGSDLVAICPIEPSSGGTQGFVGEEYLGLYRTLEKIRWPEGSLPSVVPPFGSHVQLAASFARGQGNYVELVK